MECTLNGNLGSVSFSDSKKRSPQGLCAPKGQLCQLTSESRARLNATSMYGQCSTSCECVPLSMKELEERQRGMFMFGYGFMVNQDKHEVKTEAQLHKLPFQLSLPATDLRRMDKCERFEQQSYAWALDNGNKINPDDQCKNTCVVQGNFGNVEIRLPERPLKEYKHDGTHCYLKVAETEDISAIGVKQAINGKCKQGICIPQDDIKVVHFNHPQNKPTERSEQQDDDDDEQ